MANGVDKQKTTEDLMNEVSDYARHIGSAVEAKDVDGPMLEAKKLIEQIGDEKSKKEAAEKIFSAIERLPDNIKPDLNKDLFEFFKDLAKLNEPPLPNAKNTKGKITRDASNPTEAQKKVVGNNEATYGDFVEAYLGKEFIIRKSALEAIEDLIVKPEDKTEAEKDLVNFLNNAFVKMPHSKLCILFDKVEEALKKSEAAEAEKDVAEKSMDLKSLHPELAELLAKNDVPTDKDTLRRLNDYACEYLKRTASERADKTDEIIIKDGVPQYSKNHFQALYEYLTNELGKENFDIICLKLRLCAIPRDIKESDNVSGKVYDYLDDALCSFEEDDFDLAEKAAKQISGTNPNKKLLLGLIKDGRKVADVLTKLDKGLKEKCRPDKFYANQIKNLCETALKLDVYDIGAIELIRQARMLIDVPSDSKIMGGAKAKFDKACAKLVDKFCKKGSVDAAKKVASMMTDKAMQIEAELKIDEADQNILSKTEAKKDDQEQLQDQGGRFEFVKNLMRNKALRWIVLALVLAGGAGAFGVKTILDKKEKLEGKISELTSENEVLFAARKSLVDANVLLLNENTDLKEAVDKAQISVQKAAELFERGGKALDELNARLAHYNKFLEAAIKLANGESKELEIDGVKYVKAEIGPSGATLTEADGRLIWIPAPVLE